MKLNDIYIRDPFVLVEDDNAYMFGTTDETAWDGLASGFTAYKTKDLTNFTPAIVFARPADFWSTHNFWAPEVHKYKGRYYMIASFKADNTPRACQILVCDTPDGKYTVLSEPITPKEWECLDGTLFVDDDNTPYLVFCHEWTQIKNGEICAIRLADDLKTSIGQPVTLFKATDAPWVVSLDSANNFVTDGPFLHRNNGKIFMLWSSVGKNGYALGVASSRTLLGDWQQEKEPLFGRDGGHGMLFSFLGQLYIALHCPNSPHLSERAKFFKVKFAGDKLQLEK